MNLSRWLPWLHLAILVGAGWLPSCSGRIAGPNLAPIANAGADRIVNVGETATLDGSGSFDPDGDEIFFRWALVAAPEAGRETVAHLKGMHTELTPDQGGAWIVRLVVSDGLLLSTPDAVLVIAAKRPCLGDMECDDGDPCTEDSCDRARSVCKHDLAPVAGAEGPWSSASCADRLDDDCDRLVDEFDPDCRQCQNSSDCDDGDPCTADTCEANERCVALPVDDGAPCDDGRSCTDADRCTNGACAGLPRDCSVLDDSCNQGLCDPLSGTCVKRPANEGGSCSDSAPCSTLDTCRGGVCVSGPTNKDSDRDGYFDVRCPDGNDCDDSRAVVNPGATEGPTGSPSCQDGLDNDCDGTTDREDLFRKQLTIDSKQVDGTNGSLSDFPILVSLEGDTDLRTHVKSAAGDDLNFRDASGMNGLDHELEQFDPVSGTLLAWVRLPVLAASADTVITLYYGNSCADSSGRNPPGVWNSDFKGVWHLNEKVDDELTDGTHHDSTANCNHGRQERNDDATGKTAGGQSFDGDGDFIEIGNPESFQLGNADCTISAWINTSSSMAMGIVVKSSLVSHEANDKLFGVNHTLSKLGLDQGWVTYLGGTSDIVGNGWHHVVWTQKKDDLAWTDLWTLYVDGRSESSLHAATYGDVVGHTLRIGGSCPTSYFPNHFNGVIDEVRISSTVRSAGWIKTSYNNQMHPNKRTSPADGFLTVGNEAAMGAGR